MFAVIYRGYTKKGLDSEYQQAWAKVAQHFVSNCGAIGSCLHQTQDGMWVAYSRWPNKATRDAAWPGEKAPSIALPEEIRSAILTLKNCLDPDRLLPEICMQVVDDLLMSKN